MRSALEEALCNSSQLGEKECKYIASHFKEHFIRKKEHLFVTGEICKLAAFCEKGCFRKYFVNERGEEIVVDFAIENYWVGDLQSLINRVPTGYNFQALEDSTLQILPYSTWEKLSNEIPAFGKARKEKELRSHGQAVEMLAFEKYATAEEKFEKMIKRFPGITLRVASIHLASYLGIKPESFSRLKRKFSSQ
jgi:CRP-like cAMP-binding protein